jgi:hypothetical protein
MPAPERNDSLEWIVKATPRDILERCYIEAEAAKQLLQKAGIGWTGLGIAETAQLAVEELEAARRGPAA